jgi:hypothetical protein
MRYLLGFALLVVLISMGSVWAISHFFYVLRVLIPLGMLSSFVAGFLTCQSLRRSCGHDQQR